MATAIYTRISQDRDDDRAGVARQEDACRELADRLGWGDVVVYCDNDASAFSGKRRPEYERLLDAIKAGVVDRVVAWAPDRIYRRISDMVGFVSLVNEHDVAVATVNTGAFDLSSPLGRSAAYHQGIGAETESAIKSERHKAKAEQMAREGRYNGGPRVYGWSEGMVGLEADEAAVLVEAATRVLDGENPNSIARDFNRRGIPTATGKEWRRTVLVKMLTHPRIAGKRTRKGEVVGEATWPAILDEQTAAQVRAVLEPKDKRPTKGTRHLLTGLLVDEDGEPLFGAGEVRYRTRLPEGRRGCQVSKPAVDAIVVEAVLAVMDEHGLPVRDDSGGDPLEVERLRGELDVFLQAYERGELLGGEYLRLTEAVKGRLAAAEAALSASRGVPAWLAAMEQPGALREAWPGLSLAQQQSVLGVFLEAVVVSPGRPGSRDVADRLEFVWRA